MPHAFDARKRALVIGAGPAGLMAAENLAECGVEVDVFDAMPSAGRKFLMAGRGGLNITRSEPFERFLACYGTQAERFSAMLSSFGPDDVRAWINDLGIETFVGSSGRVFPEGMKAAPLLRAWLHRLRERGVRFHPRHRWQRLERDSEHRFVAYFDSPDGPRPVSADAIVLAMGGASWPKLGSDGGWIAAAAALGVDIAPFRPANCGFDIAWSAHLIERFAGTPVKTVAATWNDPAGRTQRRPGEFVVTRHGIEGSLIYWAAAALREEIACNGAATLRIDLLPDWSFERVAQETARPRGARSLSSHLASRLGLKGVKTALLRECATADELADPQRLASAIKSLPLRLIAPRPLEEAISSAGGVRFDALDARLMHTALPGLFFAGEMLDWEAPTGGYLLTGCLTTGRTAGLGAATWLTERPAR